jgi:hypothetical protein
VRRPTLLLPILPAALVLPLLTASPAHAADNVICVNITDASCTPGEGEATIAAAIVAANTNGSPDTILVGPGTYAESLPQLDGSTHAAVLQGSGQGSTVIAPPADPGPDTLVSVYDATLRGLTVDLPDGIDNDEGISAYSGAVLESVTVNGTGTSNTAGVVMTGSQASDLTILMPLNGGTRAIFATGTNTITDSTLQAGEGVNHSDPGGITTLSRLSIRSDTSGVVTDGGTVAVDNAVIDLGTDTGVGLRAENGNPGTSPMVIEADHVTIVGGTAGSRGVLAAGGTGAVAQSATVDLTNSIIRGPSTSIVASTASGIAGSTATVDVGYSDYQTTSANPGPNGTATVNELAGNVTDVDPGFVDAGAGDFRLTPGSPVVDKGDPAPGGPATDRGGDPRVVDGDAVPGAVRDMGAYELGDSVPPETTITAGPSGLTKDRTPTFGFVSVPDATFECQVDSGAFAGCASPFTTVNLSDGPHTFTVRATDLATNVETTPAVRTFTVDTVAPQTAFGKKPAKKVFAKKVKFTFSSDASGSTFQCKRDNKPWEQCSSAHRWKKLKLGKHVFRVRSVDAAGNVDATPATYRFKRIERPRSGCTGEC